MVKAGGKNCVLLRGWRCPIHRKERLSMAEYIERELAVQAVVDTPCRMAIDKGKVIRAVEGVPLADVVEVRHGHWILEKEPNGKPYCFHCSVCDEDFRRIDIRAQTPYCPHCGARMDGKGDRE